MGNNRLLVAALALTLAACGDDGGSGTPDAITIIDSAPLDTLPPDAPPIDAPSFDLACHGNSAPTTIAGTVTVSGTVNEISLSGLTPMAGASVTGCVGDCLNANILDTDGPTQAAGTFSLGPIATNGTAVDGYVRITANGYWPTRIYPHAPLAANLSGAPTAMVTQALVNMLGLAGISQTPGNGLVAVVVTDCAATPAPIGGATIAVTAGGNPVGDDSYDLGTLDPAFSGIYVVADVPPGEIVVTVTYSGMTFLANTATVIANGLTGVQIKPGY